LHKEDLALTVATSVKRDRHNDRRRERSIFRKRHTENSGNGLGRGEINCRAGWAVKGDDSHSPDVIVNQEKTQIAQQSV
jgi:hypothetical protein